MWQVSAGVLVKSQIVQYVEMKTKNNVRGKFVVPLQVNQVNFYRRMSYVEQIKLSFPEKVDLMASITLLSTDEGEM